jgi:putative ABC transport system permease protein
MQIQPILAALRRHKAGTILIALQIALTLAIVCNALYIIHQRVAHLSESSGVDEANVGVINNMWGESFTTQQAAAQIEEDLASLRQIPGVTNATATNAYPLAGRGWDNFVTLKPDQTSPTTDSGVYLGDENFIDTFGAHLKAGRNFTATEINNIGDQQNITPSVAIVSQALADRIYPNGDALGKVFYSMSSVPITIIGIVDRFQRADVGSSGSMYDGQILIWPLRESSSTGVRYVVHAQPGQLDTVLRKATQVLYANNRMRIFDPKDGVETYAQIRRKAYDSDRGMAILMGIICLVLLAITGAGIVGLTSFWVGQRRRQIGVRRALGASHRDILSYFLTENLLISLGGVVLGIVLTFGLNFWLMSRFMLHVMPITYVVTGIVILLLLGQCAVLAPALRASRVPPIEATRAG